MHHKLNMVSSLFSLRLNIYIHLGLTVVTINITADSSLSDYKGRYFRLSADVLHSESSSYIDKLDRCTCRSFLSFFLPLNKWQIKCKDHKMHVLHPLAANTVDISWHMDPIQHWRGGTHECDWFEAVTAVAQHSFMLDWRSIAAGGGRGRCHRLALVWETLAEEARCQSSCYRKSPHSSYSGAVERDRE